MTTWRRKIWRSQKTVSR